MSSRASIIKKIKGKKKGLSQMIGYILLIALAVIMSALVYRWMKTYTPKDVIQCPDGVSVFIKDVYYDCAKQEINLTLKNNGKFSIAGYFIHVTNKSNQELATIDLSSGIKQGGENSGNSVIFSSALGNGMTPEEGKNTRSTLFDTSGYGTLYRIEIIPVRYQEEDNRLRFVSCGGAKVSEALVCN